MAGTPLTRYSHPRASSNETFFVKLEIKYVYEIEEADRELYEQAKKCSDNAPKYQEWHDKGIALTDEENAPKKSFKFPPPVVEFRNAVEDVKIEREQVTDVYQGAHLPGGGEEEQPDSTADKWFVTLTGVYSLKCYEKIELEAFPFSRQGLQVRLVCKQNTNQAMLAPFNYVVPPAVYRGQKAERNFDYLRPNTYKHFIDDLGTWVVRNHHIAFLPLALTPKMPSGNKFSRALITIQIAQEPRFYLLKVVVVFFPVTLMSSCMAAAAKEVDQEVLANQLALVLALAAYTITTTDWQPMSGTLSYLDKYILFSLVQLMCTCTWLAMRHLFLYVRSEHFEGCEEGEGGFGCSNHEWETWMWIGVGSVNFLVHFLFLLCSLPVVGPYVVWRVLTPLSWLLRLRIYNARYKDTKAEEKMKDAEKKESDAKDVWEKAHRDYQSKRDSEADDEGAREYAREKRKDYEAKRAEAEIRTEARHAAEARVASWKHELKLIQPPSMQVDALVRVAGHSWFSRCLGWKSKHSWLLGRTGKVVPRPKKRSCTEQFVKKLSCCDRQDVTVRLDGSGLQIDVPRNELELINSSFWEWMRPSWQKVFQEERRQLKVHQMQSEADTFDAHLLDGAFRRPLKDKNRSKQHARVAELNGAINVAVADEDYVAAAELQEKLKAFEKSLADKVAADAAASHAEAGLEQKIKDAAARKDYAAAAELQTELRKLEGSAPQEAETNATDAPDDEPVTPGQREEPLRPRQMAMSASDASPGLRDDQRTSRAESQP